VKERYGLTLDQLRELALKDTFFFASGIAGFTRLNNPPHRKGALLLQNPNNRQVGFVWPRGTGKSSLMKARLLQLICQNPNVRILYISKTQGRAAGGVKDLRNRIMGKGAPLIPVLWPELVPRNTHEVRWAGSAFEVNRSASWDEATVESAGVGTNKTGFHYDVLFFDDPLSPDKDDMRTEDILFSDEEVSKVIGYMQLATLGLFDPQGLHMTLFGGTRYATNDIVDWIKDHWPNMALFEQPIEDENGVNQFPSFWTDEMLAAEQAKKGSFYFQSQFKNNPVDLEHKAFHTEDIQLYDRAPSLRSGFVSIQIDPGRALASGRVKGRSKTAVLVALTAKSGEVYVLDYRNEFIGMEETAEAALRFATRYDPDVIMYEKVGYQSAVESRLRDLQRKKQKRWRIEGTTRTRASKDSRILEIQPHVQNHELYVKRWMVDLIKQLDDFPYGKQLDDFPYGDKDLLDALADHIVATRKYGGSLPYQLRIRGIEDRFLEEGDVPSDGTPVAAVYITKTEDGTSGFIIKAVKKDGKIYVTDALSVGEGDYDISHLITKAAEGREVITSKEVWDTFLRGKGMKAKKRVLKSQFPADAAVARLQSGEVCLTEQAAILTGYASSIGLEALEFLAEHCGKGGLKAVTIG